MAHQAIQSYNRLSVVLLNGLSDTMRLCSHLALVVSGCLTELLAHYLLLGSSCSAWLLANQIESLKQYENGVGMLCNLMLIVQLGNWLHNRGMVAQPCGTYTM